MELELFVLYTKCELFALKTFLPWASHADRRHCHGRFPKAPARTWREGSCTRVHPVNEDTVEADNRCHGEGTSLTPTARVTNSIQKGCHGATLTQSLPSHLLSNSSNTTSVYTDSIIVTLPYIPPTCTPPPPTGWVHTLEWYCFTTEYIWP